MPPMKVVQSSMPGGAGGSGCVDDSALVCGLPGTALGPMARGQDREHKTGGQRGRLGLIQDI